jgi:2-C-methyl-D-erythritol 4-phosphate cytidylyltransferase
VARRPPRARGRAGSRRVTKGQALTPVWAVLVAAGKGERLAAGRPKAFAALAGRPLLAESLERLDECDLVDAIVVVAPVGWEEPSIMVAEELGAGKVASCVAGGATRAESVRLGVAEVPEDAGVILVHDAARPLVTTEVVARLLEPLDAGWDGAVPGLRIADTVKRVGDDGTIAETVERTTLATVQTPQAFAAGAFRRALASSASDLSDCSGYVETAGGRVRVVEGDPGLLKVTTSRDLAVIERLLAER